ncbi:MAG: signal peptidase I [Gammaproteobacteria bacterium]|nr:signal peptidase I [Gammaproteobacteria bacterium]
MGQIDFAWVLLVATVVSGLIWLLDHFVWLPKRKKKYAAEELETKEPIIVDYARSFFPILLLVLLIRSFWFEPFRIPSASMVPTLLEGDFILVSKYSYGLRLPIVNKKFVNLGSPKRGDVMVFRLPSNPKIYYIKRLVGLPGDVVEYRHRRLKINGQLIPMTVEGLYEGPGQTDAKLANELLGEADHQILHMLTHGSREGVFRVPAGQYFVMGDNRDNSKDSRYQGVGFVPEQNLVGRAVRIWMHLNLGSEDKVRWSRIGDQIQ